MDVKSIGVILGLFLSAGGLVFSAVSNLMLRKQLRNNSNTAVYEVAFKWVQLLLENPEYYDTIENPSGGKLTDEERAIAEYRLDVLEFVYRQKKMGLYGPESGSLRSSLDKPLIRKAIKDERVRSSIRDDFYRDYVKELKRDE